jgi:RecD/TraA family predicted helicase
MKTFQGGLLKAVDGPKVVKVSIKSDEVQANHPLLYFKDDDSLMSQQKGMVSHSDTSLVSTIKERHVPLFLEGSTVKTSCVPYESSWVIKGITVFPPRDIDNAHVWLCELCKWMTTLKDLRKKATTKQAAVERNKDEKECKRDLTLTEIGRYFSDNYVALKSSMRVCLDGFVGEDESRPDILEYFITKGVPLLSVKARPGDIFPKMLLDVLSYVSTVYERLGLFHKLKDDVVRNNFESRIPDADVLKVIKFAKDYAMFVHNPYKVYKSKKTARLTFTVLDLFACMYGVSIEKRIISNVWHCMQQVMSSEGHVCYDLDVICDLTWRQLKPRFNHPFEGLWSTVLTARTAIKDIVVKHTSDFVFHQDKWLYLRYVFEKEMYIIDRVTSFIDAMIEGEEDVLKVVGDVKDVSNEGDAKADVDTLISKFEEESGIALHDLQRDAVSQLFKYDTSMQILTGFPGTGKSSVVKCIKRIAEEYGLSVLICAPTGKAANRLGDDASTIHRALQVVMEKDDADSKFKFLRNESNPFKEQIVIVDETSMLDLDLAFHLFKAISTRNVRVLFLGDYNQLPSVSYGDVLKSLVDSAVVYTTHLTKVFRQGNGSMISKLSRYVVKGKIPPQKYLSNDEVEYFKVSDPQKIHRLILELYMKHKQECMILIPTKKGDVGTLAVNSTIHRYLYKEDAQEKYLRFRPGEKIICVVNSYTKDDEGEVIPEQSVFNGESGVFLKYLDKSSVEVDVEGKRVVVDKDVIEMGFSISCHKSQGSEYDCVILVLHESHSIMLNREVFYTAMTRSKKKLYIIGTDACIEKCIQNKCPVRFDCMREILTSKYEIESQEEAD